MAPLLTPKWPLTGPPSAFEGQNKAPIYVTGVTDTRGFVTWLRASCRIGLSAQTKGEKQMLVPHTTEGFSAAVSALRSLDGSKSEFSHLSEDRCLRMLIKKLGRHMPEGFRKALESLSIWFQGVLQIRSGRRKQEAVKARP